MGRKKAAKGKSNSVPSAAAWPVCDQSAAREAFELWRLGFTHLVPALVAAYLGSAAAVALLLHGGGRPAAWGGALLLWLAGSGVGQTWGAAFVLLTRAGVKADGAAVWRVVKRGAARLAANGLLRAVMVYAPLAVVVAMAVVAYRGQPPRPNPIPILTVVVGAMTVNIGILTCLLPCAVLAEPGGGPLAALTAARDRGFLVWGGLLGWGALLLAIIVVSSLMPYQNRFYPVANHLVGSYLWLVQAVFYVRARRREQPDWTPSDLRRALGEEADLGR
jgi:hypothetical protein